MSIWDRIRRVAGSPENPSSPRELFVAEVEAILAGMPNVTSVSRRPHEFGLDLVDDGEERTGSENDRTHLRVPWATFQELAGGCLTQVSGLNPRRYRTGDWPSEQTLSALERATK